MTRCDENELINNHEGKIGDGREQRMEIPCSGGGSLRPSAVRI